MRIVVPKLSDRTVSYWDAAVSLKAAVGRAGPPGSAELLASGQLPGPGEPSGAAHQATLERVFGRILAVFITLMVAAFWSSSATLAGQKPGSVAATLVLSVLLVWQALRAGRR